MTATPSILANSPIDTNCIEHPKITYRLERRSNLLSRFVQIIRLLLQTRSSRFCSGAIGRQVVDFASIDVKHRGDKYLTQLLEYLAASQSRLKATHFYFENVANLRLGQWLERQGFEVLNGEPGSIASYCRQILPGAPQARVALKGC